MLFFLIVGFVIGYFVGVQHKDHKYPSQLPPRVPSPPINHNNQQPALNAATTVATQASTGNTLQQPSTQAIPVKLNNSKTMIDVDNTSLLLYFGAFLFITSMGLFVAYGNVGGGIRTLLTAIVAVSMYGFGFYLHQNHKRLKETGEMFVGIGMSVVPFVGLAAYTYQFDESHGSVIWAITSIVALTTYVATALRLKSTFTALMLIGGFVSVSMSALQVIDAPIYYFAWALAVVGIALQLLGLKIKSFTQFTSSSHIASQLFMAITLVSSTLMVVDHGYLQLAMSLGIASLYFVLQAQLSAKQSQQNYVAAHALAVVAVAPAVYSISHSVLELSTALITLGVLHALVGLTVADLKNNKIAQGIMNTALLASAVGIVASVQNSLALAAALLTFSVLSLIVAYRQRNRLDAFTASGVAWIVLSVVVGQLVPAEYIHPALQAGLTACAGLVFVYVALFNTPAFEQNWKLPAVTLTVLASTVSLVFAGVAGPVYTFSFGLGMFLFFSLLANINHKQKWQTIGLYALATPMVALLLQELDNTNTGLLTISIVATVAGSVYVALRHKLEHARWQSTIAWLLLPWGLFVEGHTDYRPTMWLFVLVAVVLSLSRAIASGRILPHDKVPLASLAKSSSTSYIDGMAVAAVVAMAMSAYPAKRALESVTIIALIGVMFIAHGIYIERDKKFLILVSLFAQLIIARLASSYNPGFTGIGNLNVWQSYTAISLFIALIVYVTANLLTYRETKQPSYFSHASLIAIFVAPVSVLFVGKSTIAMPLGLGIGSLAVCYSYWHKLKQSQKELVLGSVLLSVYWGMYMHGVHNIQAYTHVLAALLAGYAYWSYKRGDQESSRSYQVAMLVVSTVPLTLQALNSPNGDVYGLWLLFEQVIFMLLGMFTRRSLLTKWGLYTAVGAVLYQLRGLGWGTLVLLSLFIIGVAVYRSLKQTSPTVDAEDKPANNNSKQQ